MIGVSAVKILFITLMAIRIGRNLLNKQVLDTKPLERGFKDKRMRRNLEVGVAYGSDIELVQRTLMDIARGNKHVYKHPMPDVLFIDHAASALTFR